MRTIGFRGKQITTGKWLYGDLMHDSKNGCYIYPIDAGGLYKDNKVIPETIGQFTGLCDKNGKKIYEGDIIRIKEPNGMYSEAELQFCERGYWAINHRINDRVIAGFVDKKQIEIIGNIHDNPELLEK